MGLHPRLIKWGRCAVICCSPCSPASRPLVCCLPLRLHRGTVHGDSQAPVCCAQFPLAHVSHSLGSTNPFACSRPVPLMSLGPTDDPCSPSGASRLGVCGTASRCCAILPSRPKAPQPLRQIACEGAGRSWGQAFSPTCSPLWNCLFSQCRAMLGTKAWGDSAGEGVRCRSLHAAGTGWGGHVSVPWQVHVRLLTPCPVLSAGDATPQTRWAPGGEREGLTTALAPKP